MESMHKNTEWPEIKMTSQMQAISAKVSSDGESNPWHHGDSAIFRPLDHLGVTSIAADFELYHK